MPSTVRILFIEDNESDAVLIQAHLRRAGYAVVARRVETAPEMAAALAEGEWDVILSDYSLPQFGSLEALQALHASGRDLPFIIVSGTIQEEQAVAVLRAGAHDFIVKDRLARLAPALERELREAQNRRARREAVLAMQAQEARSQALIEHSSDAISLLGPDGRLQYVSPSTERILGYSRDEVLGADPASFIHPDDLPAVLAQLGDLAQRPGQTVIAQYRFRHKDGSWRWLEASINNLLAEPSVGALVFNYRDITQRLEAEAAQKQSEALFRSLFELMPDAVVLIDPHADGISWPIIDCNLAACRMNGYERHELVGQSVDVLNISVGTLAEREIYFRELRQVTTRNFDTYHRRKDGQVFPVEVSTSLIRIGERELIIGIDRDITERRRAEQAVQTAEDKYRTLVENIPSIIYQASLDEFSSTLYVSPQCEQLGYSQAEHLADPQLWLKMIHPDDRARVIQEIGATSVVGAPFQLEYRVLDRAGREHWLRDESVAVLDAAGQPLFLQGVLMDITDRKRAEADLAQERNLLRTLVDNIPDLIYAKDAASRFTLANRASAASLGRTPDEVVGQTDFDLHPPELAAQFFADEQAVMRSGQPLIDREERVVVDGQERWLLTSTVPLQDAAGQVAGLVGISRDITERRAAAGQIELQLKRLAALRDIDSAITGSVDLRLTIGILLGHARVQLAVDAADILLLTKGTQALTYADGSGFRTSGFQKAPVRLGQGRAGQAVLERRIISMTEGQVGARPSPRTGQLAAENFVSYYGAPIIAKGAVLGVLEIFNRSVLQPDAAWLEFLEALAGQAAIAIENATLFEGLQRSNDELSHAYASTLEGWSAALDLRDRETEGHSRRVTLLTVELAEKLGVAAEDLVHIHRGALLHDIGKMGVPDHILLKPGPLTDDEWVLMRKHPDFAYALLSPITYLRRALDIPYCHHEKWDGTGYPRGLRAEAIPLAARLFSVVDVWDALRSDRSYRPAWTVARTAEHIRQESGRAFDPAVVDAFLKLVAPA